MRIIKVREMKRRNATTVRTRLIAASAVRGGVVLALCGSILGAEGTRREGTEDAIRSSEVVALDLELDVGL
jgi:hypothetical protein